VSLRLVNVLPPSGVMADGVTVPFSRYGGAQAWTYDGDDVAVVIEVRTRYCPSSLCPCVPLCLSCLCPSVPFWPSWLFPLLLPDPNLHAVPSPHNS